MRFKAEASPYDSLPSLDTTISSRLSVNQSTGIQTRPVSECCQEERLLLGSNRTGFAVGYECGGLWPHCVRRTRLCENRFKVAVSYVSRGYKGCACAGEGRWGSGGCCCCFYALVHEGGVGVKGVGGPCDYSKGSSVGAVPEGSLSFSTSRIFWLSQ